eukprot:TRINITY_DN1107_c1_g1_i11.p1 TRINITY_DN1107_c1_g1~~TRINITY_DN1107_c1_g1_i11.p1  ORF type:complete len:311 (+),score=58.30 TRINITY_DN1107_c1_g1_i11:1453-2385(+)
MSFVLRVGGWIERGVAALDTATPAPTPTPSSAPTHTPKLPLTQGQGLLDYTPTPTYTPRGPTDSNIDQRLLDSLERFYQLREKSPQFAQLKSPFECETEDEGGDEGDEVGAVEDGGKFMSKQDSDMSQFLRQKSAGLLNNNNHPGNSLSYPLNSFLSNFSVRNEEEDPHFVNFASTLSDSKTYNSLPLSQQQQQQGCVQLGSEGVVGDGKEDDGDIDGTLGKRSSYVKQKNREAQRRFRAKQKKKISELQLLVSVLQQESGTLLSENKHLKGQNNNLVQEVEQLKMENEQLRSLLVRDFIQEMVKTRATC